MVETITTNINETAAEDEKFWRNHAKLQKESGLSKIAYCRKHQLNYDKFAYRERKWRQVSTRLIPVQLDSFAKTVSVSHPIPTLLCTLTFKKGGELKIYDKSILAMILSLME